MKSAKVVGINSHEDGLRPLGSELFLRVIESFLVVYVQLGGILACCVLVGGCVRQMQWHLE